MDVKVRENGTNAAIKAHILPEKDMRRLGFTDHGGESWYLCKGLHPSDISFNVTIPKNDPDDLRIDVLDENFLQPYDYQRMLESGSSNKCAMAVKRQVDKLMAHLVAKGVLSGWEVGDYV